MSRPQQEVRTTRFLPRIVRSESGEPKIVGYAARFEELSNDLGYFIEKIRKGAFIDVLDRDDVRALFNHDPNFVLGRISAGTLRLFEDDEGLRYEIKPPKAQWAQDLILSIERGDIRESSFGFWSGKEEWNEETDPPIRTIIKVQRLFDVGPVTFAAYPTASTAVRSAQEVYETRNKPSSGDEGETWSQQNERLLRRLTLV